MTPPAEARVPKPGSSQAEKEEALSVLFTS